MTPQPTRSKHIGGLLLLAAIVAAWIVTPFLMGMQEEANMRKMQLEQQHSTLSRSLATAEAQAKEFNAKSATERLKVIAAIPEKGKVSQANVLREIEGILTGTSGQLRNISFDTGTYSEGSGPKAIPLSIELSSPDAATVLQLLKKFEAANRLFREEGMTLTKTDTGVTAQLRLNVYSRE